MEPRGFPHPASSPGIGGTLAKVWKGMLAKPKEYACDLLEFSDGAEAFGFRKFRV